MQIPQETKGTLVQHWWFIVIDMHCKTQLPDKNTTTQPKYSYETKPTTQLLNKALNKAPTTLQTPQTTQKPSH